MCGAWCYAACVMMPVLKMQGASAVQSALPVVGTGSPAQHDKYKPQVPMFMSTEPWLLMHPSLVIMLKSSAGDLREGQEHQQSSTQGSAGSAQGGCNSVICTSCRDHYTLTTLMHCNCPPLPIQYAIMPHCCCCCCLLLLLSDMCVVTCWQVAGSCASAEHAKQKAWPQPHSTPKAQPASSACSMPLLLLLLSAAA